MDKIRVLVAVLVILIAGALEVLHGEVQPVTYSPIDSPPEYRKSLATGLFYKVGLLESICS